MSKSARTTAKHNIESAVAQSETAVMAKRYLSETISGRDVSDLQLTIIALLHLPRARDAQRTCCKGSR